MPARTPVIMPAARPPKASTARAATRKPADGIAHYAPAKPEEILLSLQHPLKQGNPEGKEHTRTVTQSPAGLLTFQRARM